MHLAGARVNPEDRHVRVGAVVSSIERNERPLKEHEAAGCRLLLPLRLDGWPHEECGRDGEDRERYPNSGKSLHERLSILTNACSDSRTGEDLLR